MKITTITLLTALAALTACETMEGLGRDTEKAGNSLENAAEKNDNNPHDDSSVQGQ